MSNIIMDEHQELDVIRNPNVEPSVSRPIASTGCVPNDLTKFSLHQAARDGLLENIQRYIVSLQRRGNHYKKYKLNKKDRQDLTALHYSIRHGHYQIVHLLITSGADIHIEGEDGAQPIHFAARYLKCKIRTRKFTCSTFTVEHFPEHPTERESDGAVMDEEDEDEGAILKYLLKNGADPNAVDYYGQTPLHYSTLKGNIAAAEILLNNSGADVEAVDKSNATPLHSACGQGNVSMVKMLMAAGAKIIKYDDDVTTPFHHAILSGHLEVIQTIFDICQKKDGYVTIRKLLTDGDHEGETCLHMAVDAGYFNIVQFLLKNGADVNQVRNGQVTPLHLAATSGHLEIVEILLTYKADLEARNIYEETPLHKAASYDRVDTVKFLIAKGADVNSHDSENTTPLIAAASNSNTETVDCLLKCNVDITVKDSSERTALFWAAEENAMETLQVLLNHREAKNLLEEKDRYDNTPLHTASKNGFLGIVRLLLEKGAQIDPPNDEELTPLHLAAKYGRVRVVKELLKKMPAAINDEDEGSNTPLHLAALSGHAETVQTLLNFGASVDARNALQWTPLDCAAAKGHEATCRILLDRDSPVDPTDKAKTTPLHLASKGGHVEVVEVLIDNGADITLTDHDGRNCLDMAVENKHRDVAAAILNHIDLLKVMRNRCIESWEVTSPMRRMIRKLPDIALIVFNKSIKFSHHLRNDDPNYKAVLFFEFLDDTFADWENEPDLVDGYDEVSVSSKDMADTLSLKKKLEEKKNHPLAVMTEYKQEKLLTHPLVQSLLDAKWCRFGRHIYYPKLFLYIVFLAFLTGYVVVSTPMNPAWKTVNGSKTCVNPTHNKDKLTVTIFVEAGRFIILALAGIQLFMEISQLLSRGLRYFSLENMIEWIIFTFVILYVADDITDQSSFLGKCGSVHASIGSLAIFFAWINLLLFLRKFPKFGIYVVMFSDVLLSFSTFSVTFSMFIVAFALGFFILLHTQMTAFSTPGRSIVKMIVMMIGEFDFDDIFNDDKSPTQPTDITWLLFVTFVIVMTIIVMNLLVGLAVDDIKAVQEQALLNRMKMQSASNTEIIYFGTVHLLKPATLFKFDLSPLEEEIRAIFWESVSSGLVSTPLILAIGDRP